MNDNDQQFRSYDAPRQAQQVRIEWTREEADDETADRPDQSDDGFWPARKDYDSAADYVAAEAAASERMKAWEAGCWRFIGVRAKATIHVPIGQGSFAVYELASPGLWGVESDAGEEYLNEVFEEEKWALLHALKEIGRHVLAEEGAGQ